MNLMDYMQGGVAVFAIGALVYVVRMFMCVVKNHLSHSTEANEKLANMIESMLRFLEQKK